MIGFIIWIIGVVLCVKAVLEIMKWPVDGVKKLLVAIIIPVSYTHLDVYKRQGQYPTTRLGIPNRQQSQVFSHTADGSGRHIILSLIHI